MSKILNNKLFKNTSALFVVQMMNYLAPLLVLPYLSRMLGVDGFGLVISGTSLCVFASVLTDFGFDLSATYRISRKRNSATYVSKIISAVYKIKVYILILVLLLVTTYVSITNDYNATALLAIYMTIVAQAYLAIWVYQGLQKMTWLIYIMVSSKVLYVLLILLLVRKPDDYGFALLAHSFSMIGAVMISNWIIFKQGYCLQWHVPGRFMLYMFKHSIQFFLSRAATTTTASLSTLLVHNFTTPYQTGLYGASERLLTAFRSVTAPLNQALYPYMAETKNTRLLIKIIGLLLIVVILPFSGVFYYAEDILEIIFGTEYKAGVSILRIFLVTGLIALFTMLLGYPAFAAINKIKYANISVTIGGCVQLLILVVLFATHAITTINIAWSILLIEVVVLTLRSYWFIKYLRIKD